ncbi:MAG: ATP-binding protein, partial [Sphaerochaeta sp.]|jgi:DNA replication protein DnaC|uniref:ATP-binding protein n=1 Tax=Sphaerochaeta sp. S2 TaxID=2798868 RepID=UPI0018EA1968|nr:ATP-binding protein [Sphaerochaeta sp. S2]MBJ2355820.1 ATP-binding protein [Sphaerochaeta sp. S2]MCK9348815.1 ATP-binding protein [Sphaerochaeta sp.]MDD4574664.1 ATP-binding protein [Sphaerochaeta sp.]
MTDKEKQLVMNFEQLGAESISLGLIEAFSSPSMQHVPLMDVLLDTTNKELLQRLNARAQRLLKTAKLHNTVANIDEIEYYPDRNLDKLTIDRLATCTYLENHTNVCVVGASGTGKSFISKALAHRACLHGYRTKVVSFPALMRELGHLYSHDSPKYEKKLRYYSRFPLLVIDEWLCQQPEKQWTSILLELMENRYDSTSTIICTQLPVENWPKVIGNVALGQAILGRVTASSYILRLEGQDLRSRHSAKP